VFEYRKQGPGETMPEKGLVVPMLGRSPHTGPSKPFIRPKPLKLQVKMSLKAHFAVKGVVE